MRRILRGLVIFFVVLIALAMILEIGVRVYVEMPLKTDFYGSISREAVAGLQAQFGVQTVSGLGWIHLGWIANPEQETYRIETSTAQGWQEIGQTKYGSFLYRGLGGSFRVWRVPKGDAPEELLGEVTAYSTLEPSPINIPSIQGEWQKLFQPQTYGSYINDHTIYQDANGDWRLIGITSLTEGDFNEEKYFAVGVSQDFPPAEGMTELEPVADFGELAWAPHVIQSAGRYHMFWSPHKLHQMDSADGVTWENHQVTLSLPYHKFFRDGMVLQVAPNQWLLYTTARGLFFSQIDVYQSFDLTYWQYIRTALRSGLGSERNSPFASMESPFVVRYQNHYYLSLTYNNDTFFWHGILLMFKIWLNPSSYNETLVFHADNPYDFGVYRGLTRSPTLLTRLEAHAPEWVYNPDSGQWYITTAGWPWAATLTSGEVAVAPLEWKPRR